MDMTNGLNPGVETTPATSLWPRLGDVVAGLEDVLSPASLMGECHAGFTPVEGVFHPSVPPSNSPQSQQELGTDITSPCTTWVRWAAETHWAVPPGNTRGFPLHPEGVLLEETSVIHPSVTLLNHLFYILKKHRASASFLSLTKQPPGTALTRPSPAEPVHLAK